MLEYEIKIPLTEKEFDELLKFEPQNAVTTVQTNYYYDTEDFLMNQKNITCRIREKNGECIATVKYHNCGDKMCNEEKSVAVNDEFDEVLFFGEGVKMHGTLVTERTCVMNESGIRIFRDKNNYLGVTDYELEIEYSYDEKIHAQKLALYYEYVLCEKLQIANSKEFNQRMRNAKSKSQRFFDRLKIIKNNF